ncbi:hypothetical protein B2J93_5467 [Marssonina coronariae]|uniref:Uncharacterized protein n=1 Tax=Diplocarpon coronariae TaxID=2795749 RepID=A0A218YZG4_9HELO|nr:hypothetical protein B2J93_5467 [Marssonina coronariae]
MASGSSPPEKPTRARKTWEECTACGDGRATGGCAQRWAGRCPQMKTGQLLPVPEDIWKASSRAARAALQPRPNLQAILPGLRAARNREQDVGLGPAQAFVERRCGGMQDAGRVVWVPAREQGVQMCMSVDSATWACLTACPETERLLVETSSSRNTPLVSSDFPRGPRRDVGAEVLVYDRDKM